MSKMIQIRNVPPVLHRTLKVRAADAGMSLSEYLLRELERVAERPTPQLLRERILGREPMMVRESSVEAVRAERESR